jgi:alpha,alpha-trehalase
MNMHKQLIRIIPSLIYLFAISTVLFCQSGYIEPDKDLEELFPIVQQSSIFEDSKTFVDCELRYSTDSILTAFHLLENKTDRKALRNFVDTYFKVPNNTKPYTSDSLSLNEHIFLLWSVLERTPDKTVQSSLIPLPYPYIVPGGRFREIYYWDSYFTMLGLYVDGKNDVIRNMIRNFTYLITHFGHIPNGNRSYYLSRSQPPFFSLMVDLLAEAEGDSVYIHYKGALEKEYAFWMEGRNKLTTENFCYRRLVLLPDGSILNRYWDDKATPRPESYREDVITAKKAKEMIPDASDSGIYRNLRAAAESGWDFSSRWISPNNQDKFDLYAIHTSDIVPVDLNALLYTTELTLAKSCLLTGDSLSAWEYRKRAKKRQMALLKYAWNENKSFFMDYDFLTGSSTPVYSLAAVYPLCFDMASQKQADSVASILNRKFLKFGGLITTLNKTGEQWDSPNAWAPLQMMAIWGLRNYGHDQLANEIKKRWLSIVYHEYEKSYKLLEKYNAMDPQAEGSGGEYPNQDGFGWTNGVYQYLSKENRVK